MNRRGKAASGFRQALRRSAGGRGEMHSDLLRLQDLNQRAEDRRLAGARSARENRKLARKSGTNRHALQFVECKAGFLLGPLHCGVDFDGRQDARHAREPRNRCGDLMLGPIVVRQLHERVSPVRLKVES